MYQPFSNTTIQHRSIISTTLHGRQNDHASYGIQITQLMKLFDEELKEIYWAKKALTRAMPKMIKNTTSVELINLLEEHLSASIEHIKTLEVAFEILGKKAIANKCGTIEGLLKEAEVIMETCEEGAMVDTALISVCIKIVHYEIATYGILWQFAKTLGMNDVVDLFQVTLDEEKDTLERLRETSAFAVHVIGANEEEEDLLEVYAMW